MTPKGVLLDTGFFIRLLDKKDTLHSNAIDYFKYFLENDFELIVSTIAIAEYCVRGDINELPLRNLRILPFNLNHSKRTGEFARAVFENKNTLDLKTRAIIPNDTKLFSQADTEKNIEFYISADSESFKIYQFLKNNLSPKFQFIDLKTPYNETFGILDLLA